MSKADRMMKQPRPNSLKPQTEFGGPQSVDYSSEPLAEKERPGSFGRGMLPGEKRATKIK